MAPAYPPQGAVDLAVSDMRRRLSLLAQDDQFQLEDYRTINTDRGPVRGYPGGGRGRGL